MVGMGEDEGHASIWFYVVLTVGALIFLIKPAWYMIVYHAAVSQWRRLKDEAMPLLRRRSYRPWPPVVAGAAFGVAAGGLTLLIFLRRGVESAVHLQRFAQHAPGFEEIGPWLRLPIVALAVSALAIAEELYFRGVLLGALLRWWGRSRSAIVAAAISNSFLWGLLHLANTNQPLLKFGQIFLVGLVLSEMTRRWCFESAVAGHVAMNVTAVAAGFLLSGA
jgi:membrane protease YdiL (CAAX protease family)